MFSDLVLYLCFYHVLLAREAYGICLAASL